VPTSCVFCDIGAGRQPASFVHRDHRLMAFVSNAPVNPGHLLVVPEVHAEGLSDLDADTAGEMFRLAQRLAGALRRSNLRCDAINLFLADGEAASQLVPHVHLHVIPRFPGDRFVLNSRGGVTTFENTPHREELDAAAAAIRSALAAGRGS
jgi:histidine triad (HIT) family protein